MVSEKRLLYFLKEVGIPLEVPAGDLPTGKVLARGICPLHDGADNKNAFLVFADGFACQTRTCHQDKRFGSNLHGLIRHLVYRVTGEVMGWQAAWKYASSHRKQIRGVFEEVQVRRATSTNDRPKAVTWSADDLRACLQIPDPYYLSRGYSPETLTHFNVGRCVRPLPDGEDRLLGWSIIPVLRKWWPPAGYTARNPRGVGDRRWHHGLPSSQFLFNEVHDHTDSPLIVCEGPGCVMRFFEAGYPCGVATFGNTMHIRQSEMVNEYLRSGKKRLLVARDQGEGGEKLVQSVTNWFGKQVEVISAPMGAKDFGDLSTTAVRDWMGNFLSIAA